MLATILDIAAAYFIAKRLRHWQNWLPVSLLAGAALSLAVTLAFAFGSGFTLERAGAAMLYNAAVCALSTWGFRKFSPPRRPG